MIRFIPYLRCPTCGKIRIAIKGVTPTGSEPPAGPLSKEEVVALTLAGHIKSSRCWACRVSTLVARDLGVPRKLL